MEIDLASVAVATMADLGYVADVEINGAKRVHDGNFFYGGFGCDFRTGDDQRIMIVALTPRHWRNLIELTGVDELVERLRGIAGGRLPDRRRPLRTSTGPLRPHPPLVQVPSTDRGD